MIEQIESECWGICLISSGSLGPVGTSIKELAYESLKYSNRSTTGPYRTSPRPPNKNKTSHADGNWSALTETLCAVKRRNRIQHQARVALPQKTHIFYRYSSTMCTRQKNHTPQRFFLIYLDLLKRYSFRGAFLCELLFSEWIIIF